MTAILASLIAEPWAITHDAMESILARLDSLTPGIVIDPMAEASPDQMAVLGSRGIGVGQRSGSVAVVPVFGVLSKRDTLLGMLAGGTSTNRIIGQIEAAAADDSVGSILLHIDSPGGQASGMHEAAAAVRRARERKPMVALANTLMGSAAAWLGWSADEVVASPDAVVGSQGVFAVHVDASKALEMAGVKLTYVGSSDAKTGGQDGLPLDDATRAEMQSIVDEVNGLFVSDIATSRGITPAQVRKDYGNGAMFSAREAKRRGMVDRIASYGETIARLSGVKPMRGIRAEQDAEPMTMGEVHRQLLAAARSIAAAAEPTTMEGMHQHLAAARSLGGHGMDDDEVRDMPMAEKKRIHRQKHGGDAGHDHEGMMGAADALPVIDAITSGSALIALTRDIRTDRFRLYSPKG